MDTYKNRDEFGQAYSTWKWMKEILAGGKIWRCRCGDVNLCEDGDLCKDGDDCEDEEGCDDEEDCGRGDECRMEMDRSR